MSDFYKTMMGRIFYEATMPQIARELVKLNDNLQRIAAALEQVRKRESESSANEQA